MAFQAKLPSGETLKIANHDAQTQLILQSDGESQSSSVSSGKWATSPSVFQTDEGIVVRVEGGETQYTLIKDGSINLLSEEPDLKGAKRVSLEEIDDQEAKVHHMAPMKPLEPMKPMKPLKPMGS